MITEEIYLIQHSDRFDGPEVVSICSSWKEVVKILVGGKEDKLFFYEHLNQEEASMLIIRYRTNEMVYLYAGGYVPPEQCILIKNQNEYNQVIKQDAFK